MVRITAHEMSTQQSGQCGRTPWPQSLHPQRHTSLSRLRPCGPFSLLLLLRCSPDLPQNFGPILCSLCFSRSLQASFNYWEWSQSPWQQQSASPWTRIALCLQEKHTHHEINSRRLLLSWLHGQEVHMPCTLSNALPLSRARVLSLSLSRSRSHSQAHTHTHSLIHSFASSPSLTFSFSFSLELSPTHTHLGAMNRCKLHS